MAWNQTLTNLRDLLADLYFTVQDSRRVVEEAGLKPSYIAFDNRAIVNWQNILREAQRRGKVSAIVAVAHKDYPEHPWLALARSGDLCAIRGADLQTQVEWQGLGEPDALEKIMAFSSTLLPIRFLEVGLVRARSVARVALADQTSGSGFMTDNDLLITNHHVLSSPEDARSAIAQFNYQQTAAGLDAPVETFHLAPEVAFATSRENDWTAVHVHGHPGERWGAIELETAEPKVEDRVSIVQHPGGGHKQIALHHNTIVFAGETRIQYLTDTMPGSSGSPVFDQEWRVVAVHHSGGFVREPGTRKVYYRNEGIHVNALIGGLASAGLLPEKGGGAR